MKGRWEIVWEKLQRRQRTGCSQPEKLWPTLRRPLGGSILINLSPSGPNGGIFVPLTCSVAEHGLILKGSWLKGVSEQDQKELTVKSRLPTTFSANESKSSLKGHLVSTSLCLPSQVETLMGRTFSLEREKV